MPQRYARVAQATVVEVVELIDDQNIKEMFHPDLRFFPCSSDVQPGWTHDGERFFAAVSRESDPKQEAQATLSGLDSLLPRCVEDLIEIIGIDETTLPRIMRERLRQKRQTREILRA